MKVSNTYKSQGVSQLDYLWANFGDFSVAKIPTDNPDDILTQGAVKSIIADLSGISSVQVVYEDGVAYLVVTDTFGVVLSKDPIPSGISISAFGKRQITQSDINKGCELPLGTYVYYIQLSNGNEYLAPADHYTGYTSSTIITDIVDNAIHAELKINNQESIVSLSSTDDGLNADLNLSTTTDGVILSKLNDGLQGNVVLQNSDKFIKFSLLTLEQYEQLSTDGLIDDTTMYFIKNARYFYFGQYLMMGSEGSIVLDDYYTKQDIEDKLSNYVTKEELQTELDKTTLSWNNI